MWRFSVCCSRCCLVSRSLPTLWTAALNSQTSLKVPNSRRKKERKVNLPNFQNHVHPAALVAQSANLQTIPIEWHIHSSDEFQQQVKKDKKYDFIHLIQVMKFFSEWFSTLLFTVFTALLTLLLHITFIQLYTILSVYKYCLIFSNMTMGYFPRPIMSVRHTVFNLFPNKKPWLINASV